MPSLPDTAVIILLGLLLFGPKGLAQIARQLGKLMGEFRRASNEFRMQMEEELRIAEQSDRQKQIAAVEAAAPVTPPLPTTPPAAAPADEYTIEHPHLPSPMPEPAAETASSPEPLPIASSGELSIMPPATGLPQPRTSSPSSSSIASLIEAVPKVDPPEHHANGTASLPNPAHDERPMRYTTQNGQPHSDSTTTAPADAVSEEQESLHG